MYTPARTPCIRRTLCDSPSTPSTRTPTSIPRPPASPASASSLPSDSLRLRHTTAPPPQHPAHAPPQLGARTLHVRPVEPRRPAAGTRVSSARVATRPQQPRFADDRSRRPPQLPAQLNVPPTAADSFKLSTDRRTAMKCHLNPYVLRLLAALGSIARRTARRDQRRGTAPRRCRAHVTCIVFVNPCKTTSSADTLSEFSLSDSSDDSYHPEPEPDSDCAALCPKRKRRLRTLPEATVFYGPASRWLRKVCKKMRRRSRDAHACVRISPPPALIPRHNHSHNPDDSKSLCALVKFDAALASVPALLGKCGSLGWTWWA
ncbi:hypothetical protein B0H10DRAFT_2244875 [Mycena sp. CBHHK59/15]|nr:hypothetical protein B0H10DRAFT_2244875 [Mycena sp. CBHHK59/15]